ncbi:hypothetical protein AAG906_034188 [Vitis piasezkii]
MPSQFWGDSILTATYLINRMPSQEEFVSEIRPPLNFDYLNVVVFESTPCLISTFSPNTEGHLNSGGDTELQTNRETLVYSRRPKSKFNKTLISEALKELEPVIVPTPQESGSNPDQVTNDLPIALRKQPRSCTLHPISKFVSYNALSAKCRAFTTNLDRIQIPKNIQEALKIPEWKEAVIEEIRALEKNGTWEVMNLPRGKKPMGCKWVFTVKYKADGIVERYKARLVVKGFTQTHDIDYTKTFAPLEEEVFMMLPPRFCKEEEETRSNDGRMTILIVYVDDIILTGDDTREVERLKKVLATNLRSRKGISISQRKYVLDLLTETGMLGYKLSNTPIKARKRTKSDGKPVDRERYQRLVGRLIYLSHTRPDIAFVVSVVSQYMHSPKESHLETVYKILRYLRALQGEDCSLRRVTVRSVVAKRCRGGAVAQGMCEGLWLQKLLEELHITIELPIQLYCDNKAVISISHNPVQNDKTKHIEVNRHFIKEKIEKGIIGMTYIPTRE